MAKCEKRYDLNVNIVCMHDILNPRSIQNFSKLKKITFKLWIYLGSMGYVFASIRGVSLFNKYRIHICLPSQTICAS